ncbi:MAG: PD-(D/E)XK nuclease family protein [Candidatus Syntrophoarchaeum sp.]|nr:PD-(D/E)XK nuclease family protein [Candidatus Syntrophoarchaeum sp.]
MEVNIEYNPESYYKSLDRFFQGLRNFYSETQTTYERRLTNFFQPLIFRYRVAKEIKKQTDKYLASDFNLIELIKPDENRISDLVALLLNPKGEHGQGETFLKEFIEYLKGFLEKTENLKALGQIDISQVSVEKEFATYEGRRIDIFVKFPGFVIGIENKPWAGERDRQLADYNEFLQNFGNENYILIYLDGWGREATSMDEQTKEKLKQEGKFLEVSYNNFLKPWLIKCYKECEAEKVRWFLKDFVNWIEDNFKEEVENEERKEGTD